MKTERTKGEKAYAVLVKRITPKSKAAYLRQLESGLYAAKIAACAQGLAVLREASHWFQWNLSPGTFASIWREGCIIRSQFHDLITKAYATKKQPDNLLMAKAFQKLMRDNHQPLRATVADAARAGSPVPALSSALAYFDSYRQARGSANLIQAQRDFFGAHTFERIDQPGVQHEKWDS